VGAWVDRWSFVFFGVDDDAWQYDSPRCGAVWCASLSGPGDMGLFVARFMICTFYVLYKVCIVLCMHALCCAVLLYLSGPVGRRIG